MTVVLKLKKRKDFLRVAKQGQKMVTSTVILQAAQSLSAPEQNPKTGFTTTRKIGKAISATAPAGGCVPLCANFTRF